MALFAAKEGQAAYYYSSGQACQPTSYSTGIIQSQNGAGNGNTSTTYSVVCPANIQIGGVLPYIDVASIRLFFDDKNSGSSEYFACYPSAHNGSTTYYGSYKYSCSTAGGCNLVPSSYTGTNYLEWTNPFNSGSPAYGYSVALNCSVPKKSGSAISYVWGYYFEL